jgi:cytoskeleton protein RodZ
MKSLGEFLQAERVARGISLEEISIETKISVSMLRAIEEGNAERLPAPVLVRGFLRAYATRLDLDPETVILRYEELVDEGAARQEALEKFHQRMRPKPTKKKWPVVALSIALLLGLGLLIWWPRFTQDQTPPPAKKPAPPVETKPLEEDAPSTPIVEAEPQPATFSPQASPTQTEAQPESEPAAPESVPSPAPVVVSVEPTGPQEEATVPEPVPQPVVASISPELTQYVLRAEVLEPTWLQITIDDKSMREYLLQPGGRLMWRANSKFRLLIGNAAGLRLLLNDKPIKPLGETGTVVDIQLPDPSLLMLPHGENQ